MAGQNRINFDVGFNINTANIKQLQTELANVTKVANQAEAKGTLTQELSQARDVARQLSTILGSSFNKELGTVNIAKFNAGLKEANLSAEKLRATMVASGSQGVAAYNRLATAINTTNVRLREGGQFLNQMASTMASAAKWSIAYGAMNELSNTVSQAYGYAKQLDSALTEIRIVTGDSADQMDRFAENANAAAKSLGTNTLDYAKTALSYYQQGLNDLEVDARTQTTIKAANITGSDASEMAEHLTAVWNGFQAEIGSEVDYVDKLAAVADSSASNLAELATAMSKTASVGNNMGVTMDQMTAQIATIIATTRQAPETVGNALKTIYARINDIKTDAEGAEISLGNYTKKMKELGINVLDENNNLRDTGEVFEEIGAKWGSMTEEQQKYLASTMAGQRQMNNLIALFDNWSKYSEMLNVSLDAQGTLEEKNARYLESTEAHLNTLKSTWQDLYTTILDKDEINTGIDAITTAVEALDTFLEGFGGGIKSIAAFGTAVAYIFRNQIGKAIGEAAAQRAQEQERLAAFQLQAQFTATQAASALATPQQAGAAASAEVAYQNAQRIANIKNVITQEEQEQLNTLNQQIAVEREAEAIAERELQLALQEAGLTQSKIQGEQSYLAVLTQELGLNEQEINSAEELVIAVNSNEEAQMKLVELIQTQVNETESLLKVETNKLAELNKETAAYQEQLAIVEQLAATKKDLVLDQESVLYRDPNEIDRIIKKRAAAAEKADSASTNRDFYQGRANQLQGEFNVIADYADKVELARNRTNMLMGALTGLTMSFGAVSSIVRTLNDDTLSIGQKFSQIAMTVGMMAPMIISSFNSMINGLRGYASGLIALQAQETTLLGLQGLTTASTVAEYNAQVQAGIAVLGHAEARAVLEKQIAKGLITEAAMVALLKGEEVELDKNALAAIADALALEIQGKAAQGAAVKNLELGTALKTVTAQFLAQLAALGPYIAIAAAIGLAIYGIYSELTKYERAAKEAAEAAAQLATAHREAKEEFDNTANAFKAYEDAKSQLADLTEGTRAWKEQTMAVNAQVLELLDKYPKLAQYIKNVNGVLEIDAGGMDVILNDLIEKEQKLAAAQLTASAKRSQAEADAKADSMSYKQSDQEEYHANNAVSTIKREASKDDVLQLANAINILPTAMGEILAKGQLVESGQLSKKEFTDMIGRMRAENEALDAALEGIKDSDIANIVAENTTGLYELATTLLAVDANMAEVGNLLVGSISENNSAKRNYNGLSDEEKSIVDTVVGARTGLEGDIYQQAYDTYAKMSESKLRKEYVAEGLGTEAEAKEKDSEALRDALIIAKESEILAQEGLQESINTAQQIAAAADAVKGGLDTATKSALAGYASGNKNALNNLSVAELQQLSKIGSDLLRDLGFSNEEIKEFEETVLRLQSERQSQAPAVDEDLDADQLRTLTDEIQNTAAADEELSETLQYNAADAEDVAEAILRYADAQKDLTENYEKWQAAIKDGKGAKYFDEIADAYGDLLDVDGSQLSEDFLNDAENLDLMRQALEGDTEAYEALSRAAAADILANVDINDDIDLTKAQGIVDEVQNYFDNNEAWINARVGDLVIDEGLAQQFEDFANSMGLYGQEAVDAFNSAFAGTGIQAVVDEDGTPVEFQTPDVDDIEGTPQLSPIATSILSALGPVGETIANVLTRINYSRHRNKGSTQKLKTGAFGIKFEKKPGGGTKHNRAGNLGGSTPNKTSPGSGNKGGGGGGGSTPKAPDEKKAKKDPYHDVNIKLKDNERALKRLTREEKKLTGQKYLDNLIKQNEELEKQIDLQKEKQGIADSEMRTLQEELAKYGFSFNDDGSLANYLDMMEQYKKQLDDLYNAAQANPSDEANGRYEAAYKEYQELERLIQEYDKHLETYKDSVEAQLELQDQIIENSIKRYNYTIELHLEFSDLRKEWKEFQRDVIKGIKEDDYVNLSSFGLSMAKDDLADAQELLGYVNDLQKRIQNIQNNGWDDIYGDNAQQAYEDLQKYMEELMSRGQDIASLQQEIHDNWINSIDAAKEAFDDNVENFENINDILEHNLEMLDMLYGDAKFDQAAKLYELQARNSINSLQQLMQQRDFWKQRMDSAVVGSDVWKEYKKNWEEALQDVNKAVEESAKYMYNAYEAQIENIAEKLRNALYGGNADLTNARWEHYQEDTDRYLDSIQRGSKGLSLINKYNDALAGKSLRQQKEIQKLQKAQLDNLNNQVEVREIDYEIAEKELELLLKQQALEDARDNKTKLRLRRDSQGNYRYQYVADQDQITEAERELAETAAELYELSRKDYYDTVNYIQEITDEYLDRQKEIMLEYANDEEKRNQLLAELATEQAKRIAAVGNDYEEMSNKLMQHTAAAASVLDQSLGGQLQEFTNMPDDIYEAFKEVFAPDGEIVQLVDGLASNIWTEGFAKMPEDVKNEIYAGFGLIPQQLGNIIAGALDFDKIKSSLTDMLDANEQYQANLAGLQQISNQNFNDLTTNLSDSVIATENLILNNKELMNQYGTMIDQVGAIASQIDGIMDDFRSSGAVSSLFSGLVTIGDESGTQAGSATYDLYNGVNTGTYQNADSIEELVTRDASDGRQRSLLDDISDMILGRVSSSMSAASIDDARYTQSVQINDILKALVQALDTNIYTEQDVTINADFPGITAAVELQDALTNLANQASQVTSENRRGY